MAFVVPWTVLAIYLAIEPRFYVRGFIKLFPIENRPRVKEVLLGIFETLRWWLIGKVGSMIFIALLTWIGLSILGVPLALTLGLIAGTSNRVDAAVGTPGDQGNDGSP